MAGLDPAIHFPVSADLAMDGRLPATPSASPRQVRHIWPAEAESEGDKGGHDD